MAIFALAKLAESRDSDTGAHLERVRNYCRVLAQQLASQPKFAQEIDRDFIRLVYATSPLHDIGKVGIPDCVLLKHGHLNDAEYAQDKGARRAGRTDARRGASSSFRRPNSCASRTTSRPRTTSVGTAAVIRAGLRGEEIPLCGRIVALADVYDALSSQRVYKQAYSHDVARSIIVESTGKHFDPDVVAAFLACEEQFIAIRHRYSADEPAPAIVPPIGSLDAAVQSLCAS